MIEMDNLVGTITAVVKTGATGANTITVDIDSSGFTAFAYPLTAAAPFTPAMVTPLGTAANSTYDDLSTDATVNNSSIGMLLAVGGDLGPAGADGDVCYWTAGKSFNL